MMEKKPTYEDGLRRGIERAALLIEDMARYYPEDVFPSVQAGRQATSEQIAAHMARHLSRWWSCAIRDLEKDGCPF